MTFYDYLLSELNVLKGAPDAKDAEKRAKVLLCLSLKVAALEKWTDGQCVLIIEAYDYIIKYE